MKRIALSLVLFSVGCGEFSNEDLLFLSALPRSEELAIRVREDPETATGTVLQTTEALVGDPAEFYATLVGSSAELNQNVEAILDVVNNLGRNAQPNVREDDRRVWGPFVGDGGLSAYLEINRSDDNGAFEYRYCYYIAETTLVTGDPDCVSEESNGWVGILYGSYVPLDPVEGARSGRGNLSLNFDGMASVGMPSEDRGTIEIDYDFAAGGATKTLDIVLSGSGFPVAGKDHFDINYGLDDDKNVTYHLEFADNAEDTSPENLELITIDACWKLGAPGKANITVTNGDIPSDDELAAEECWDVAGSRTFLFYRSGGVTYQEGVRENCEAVCY